MKKLYGKLNRFRGSQSKILGIGAMWGIFAVICAPAVYFRPDLMGVSGLYQSIFFLVLSFIAFLCKYKWFWGSAAFPQLLDTVAEVRRGELLWIAKKYAEWKTGFEYSYTISDGRIIVWKEEAHKAVCVFRYFLGYTVLAIASLNPLLILLGFRGFGVAKAYREEYRTWDDEVLKRAEIRVGEGDSLYLATAAIVLYVQLLAMIVWM